MEDYDYRKFDAYLGATPGNEDQHYVGSMQPFVFAAGNRMIFTLANIIKYTFRYKDKKGRQDLEKSVWYVETQLLDHDNFLPPIFMRKRITPELYIKENTQFNDMQKRIAYQIYWYNVSANVYHLRLVQSTLTDYIKDYDNNER